MRPLTIDEMDAAHRERAVLVRAHVSPMMASCRPGCRAAYDYDGQVERVTLELGRGRTVSVYPAPGGKWELLESLAKTLCHLRPDVLGRR